MSAMFVTRRTSLSYLVEAMSTFMSPNKKNSKSVKSIRRISVSKCEKSLTGELGGLYQVTTISGLEGGLRISMQKFSRSSILRSVRREKLIEVLT